MNTSTFKITTLILSFLFLFTLISCEEEEDPRFLDVNSFDELYGTWKSNEVCVQSGSYDYDIEISKPPSGVSTYIMVNNVFEIDQDILCSLSGNGCEFAGSPTINGFPVEGKMTWDDTYSTLNLEYTIKSTVEESCTSVLTK